MEISASMNGISLTHLPDEVIQAILAYTPPPAALALELTSRRFRDVANEPQLWKVYCHRSFRNWAGEYSLRHRLPQPAVEDWKRLYASRAESSRFARQTLDAVIREPLGQIDRIQSIVAHGLDVKYDMLDAFDQAAASENHLAQKWALRPQIRDCG
jgi:F-box protein 21